VPVVAVAPASAAATERAPPASGGGLLGRMFGRK
jgi:hypothetical protein